MLGLAAGESKGAGPEAPAAAEGYAISCTNGPAGPVVRVKGRDALGLLWAVTAVNQLISRTDAGPVLRAADVADYPEVPADKRGVGFGGVGMVGGDENHAGASSVNLAWFAVQFRMGCFFFDRVYMEKSKQDWRNGATEEFKKGLADIGGFLNPLGLTWYVRIHPVYGTPEQKIRSGSQEDFDAVFARASAIADAGGHLMRFTTTTVPAASGRQKGIRDSAGGGHRLHQPAVPGAQGKTPPPEDGVLSALLLGPPGPSGLPGIAGRIPPGHRRAPPEGNRDLLDRPAREVDQNWRGGSGLDHGHPPAPAVFLAERCRHRLRRILVALWHGADSCLPGLVWREFFTRVDGDTRYINAPLDCISLAVQADSVWNRTGYDPAKSVREAAAKVVGPAQVPLLADADRGNCGPLTSTVCR